jgi:hypothetical protein
MDLAAFIDLFTWRTVLLYQCTDLVQIYRHICLGIHDRTTLVRPLAKLVWLDWDSNWDAYFTRIAKTPNRIPSPGDIIIWDGNTGHIAICVTANADRFTSFDANWPASEEPWRPHPQEHNYNQVLGWLHPTKQGV